MDMKRSKSRPKSFILELILSLEVEKIKMVTNTRYFSYLIRKETSVSTMSCIIKIIVSYKGAYTCLSMRTQLAT